MRRVETYVGQQVYEWLFSAQAQNTMTAIAKLCAAMFGTSTIANGLACTPTSPATMTVQVGAGELYQMEPLEATACGTLPQNTVYNILKQGIQLGAFTTPAFLAPNTSGQSTSYLIQAQYQDSDISLDPTTGAAPVVLQFYNANAPATPWAGPNNSGATSNTFRDGIIAYSIKAGIAATTGSQVTPTPDSGYVGLWVVTVPFGATSLTGSNISAYAGAPILPASLLQSVLQDNANYAVDTGAANAYVVTPGGPKPSALTDGLEVSFYAAHANTGTSTLNAWGFGAKPLNGMAGGLQGGEIVAGLYRAKYSTATGGFALIGQGAGALQVAPATQSGQAAQLGQLGNLAGQLNLSAATTLTAANAGRLITLSGSTPGTVTLPLSSSCRTGTVFIFSAESGTWPIAASGSNGIQPGNGTSLASLTLGPGDTLMIEADGAAGWNVFGGSAQIPYSQAFSNLTFGQGQTLQDVTSSRTLNTIYTNTTGKPIVAYIQTTQSTGAGQFLSILFTTPIAIGVSEAIAAVANQTLFASVVIPPGTSYRATSSGVSLTNWLEFR